MRKKTTAARASKGRKERRAPPQLELRRAPIQARGQQTFERILTITARLLEQEGADAVTTNLIAAAAEINVATLYQYFPNKQSILVTLFDRLVIQPDKAGQGFCPAWEGRAADWRDALEQAVMAAFAHRRDMRGIVQVRRAMLTDPELRILEQQFRKSAAVRLARDLAAATGMPRSQAVIVARSCRDVVDAQLDTWIVETSGRGLAIIDETQALLSRYLQPYFENRVRRPDKRR